MPVTIKSEEFLPENIDELSNKMPELHTLIMLQSLATVLVSKNIITVEEYNETSKKLCKIQRDRIVAELNNA